MKRLVLFITVLSAAGLVISANNALWARGDDSAVQQKLMQIERDWAAAISGNNPSGIESVEADDYSYVMDSVKGNKQGDLDDAMAHAFAGKAELTDMRVRVFGNAAIVTGKAALRDAKYKGKDISGDYLFTDVFVKMNGRWQAVASQSNRVQNSGM